MERLKENCPGDCAQCKLLQSGEVNMVPCILDQIFKRVQTIQSQNESLQAEVQNLQAEVEKMKNKSSKVANNKEVDK